MELLQIGPFALHRQMLALLVSALAGFGMAWLAIRRTPWKQAPLADTLLNGFLIGFFVWKLFPALLDVSLLWPNPLKALMVTGGAMAAFAGLLTGVVYVVVASIRRGVTLRALTDAAAYGGAAFLLVQAVAGGWSYGALTRLPWGIVLTDPSLRYHPLNVYEGLVGLVVLLVVVFGRMKVGEGRAGAAALPVIGAGLVVVSLFGRGDLAPVWLLSPVQWLGLGLLVAGLIAPRLYILWETQQERRGWQLAQNDSKEQQQQARKNRRNTSPAPEHPGFNKKTDGPNRPAE